MFLRQAASFLRRIHFPSQTVIATCKKTTNALQIPLSREMNSSYQYSCGGYTWRRHHKNLFLWLIISGQAAILGINVNPVLAEDVSVELSPNNDTEGVNTDVLRRIEDGSVITNEHTAKWRVYTDQGRELFLKGRLENAETLFVSAIQEAKEGFGERDPHVASSCNNLAELYRVKKEFDKAEPLYMEAISMLEESYGPDDIRVGVAIHNLGQFYLVQRKLEEARKCYERSLKIKGRVLGYSHTDYANTMYHLATVLYRQGKEKDSEALIQDSIRILEDGGLGESILCMRRLLYLAQIYMKSNRPAEAENVQRKVLHILELSKGWNSLDTIVAAEGLALTLQSSGRLKEARELLERCLDARKTLLPEDHIQIGANMLCIARAAILDFSRPRKMDISETIDELEKAKDQLGNSIRISQKFLSNLVKRNASLRNDGVSGQVRTDGHTALVILMQSLDGLGLLEITKQELKVAMGNRQAVVAEAENLLRQCTSAFKEFGAIFGSHKVKAEYLSCLKHLLSLISDNTSLENTATLKELKDEIKRVEAEISQYRKREN